MMRIYLMMMMAVVSVMVCAQGNPIENYTELERNSWGKIEGRYRYELTYDKDGWRKSEFVYYAGFDDGKWENEQLRDIGHYSYEFDTQGRVKVKAVTYEMENIHSYRIIANYAESPVRYTRYEKDGANYQQVAEWTCYDNGALATYTGRRYTSYYSEYGELLGELSEGEDFRRTGTLNDSTFILHNGDTERYRYDVKTGRLAEYTVTEDYGRYTGSSSFEFDPFGRISKAKEMYIGSWDEDDVVYEITYTYFNDEVYPIGNSWRDVFLFEGPLTKVVGKENGKIVFDQTFNRDAQGKILSVEEYNENSDDGGVATYTVDDNGHITKRTFTWTSIDWDTEKEITNEDVATYNWQGEEMTKMTRGGNRQNEGDDERNIETFEYTHGDGSCTMKMWDRYDEINNTYKLITITEKDRRYDEQGLSYTNGKEEIDYRLVRDIQKEDFTITHPNLGKDLDGFCPNLLTPISVKDRVAVVAPENNYEVRKHGFCEETNDYFDGSVYMWYVNMSKDYYFDVRHEGESVVCYDIYDRPAFVAMPNGLILQEYWYDDIEEFHEIEFAPAHAPRKADDQHLKNVTVISYHYNDMGWCTGQSVTIYDEEGEATTEDYTYEYDLTPVNAISDDQHSVDCKVVKDGTIYIIRNGRWYTTTGIRTK